MDSQTERETLASRLAAAKWMLAVAEARQDLVGFVRFMMPDPDAYDDPTRSMYVVRPHHRLIADDLMALVRGDLKRWACSIMPQSGKTQLAMAALAWWRGHWPARHSIFGTYNADLAMARGGYLRELMQTKRYRQVFPNCVLDPAQKSKDYMVTTAGGQMAFIGRGQGGSGRPADLFLIDDPIKDDAEAQSDAAIDEVWRWFTRVVMARARGRTSIGIIHTRWVVGDLIGRICDPDHPDHDEVIARAWKYLNIPAILEVGHEEVAERLGLRIGDVLWPEAFPKDLLLEKRRLDRDGFDALYQGKPAPDAGDYFRLENITEYDSLADLPGNLFYYAASDHALGVKNHNDLTCMGVAGMDAKGDLWIRPELDWDRFETDAAVEKMIALMSKFRPVYWFMESENISRSIGPFLRSQMATARVNTPLMEIPPLGNDKRFMARSAQGLVQTRRLKFPRFAPWWPKAKKQMLQFPKIKGHDDFISFLSMLALGLDIEYGATLPKPTITRAAPGTFGELHRRWSLAETRGDYVRMN